MKHVVIVGGGFAGVRLARKLRKQKNIKTTLINKDLDFKYCPALYRAATGHKMGTARLPLEWMLIDVPNIDVVTGCAIKHDPIEKSVLLEDGTKINYDFVVFALGSVTTYFNIEGLHEHSFGIKSSDEIFSLREHLHEKMLDHKAPNSNYVIIGAGPTGVELAGALGSYVRRVAKKHHKRNKNVSIILVDAAPRILPQMSARSAKKVTTRLKKLGVDILVDTKVSKETLSVLKTSSGNIKTDTVIWTAGTMNNPFFKNSGDDTFEFAKNGRVKVNKHLEAKSSVYVIGDNAATKYSGLALTAIKHGDFVAKDITRRLKGKKRPTKYESKPIQIIPTGRRWAVLQYGRLTLKGNFIALLRKMADYIGYSDVLGYTRAMTIWTNSDNFEDGCTVCHGSKK